MLYFDHCASTPPYDEVVQAMMEVMRQHYANPSSTHQLGHAANKLLERSREVFNQQFHTKRGDWLFTSGGTESNNLALKGVARQYRSRGNHIITTNIEHPSVYEAAAQLKEEGFEITYLPVEASGHVHPDRVQEAITDKTILVSIMHVNNEVGTIQPIKEIGRLLQAYPRILFHVDAVQSIGKEEIDPEGWGIDLLSGSAHKHRGPKGVGYLYVRGGIKLHPLLSGGSQESLWRAGTQNVPAIVASAKAVRMAMEGMKDRNHNIEQLSNRLKAAIMDIPELILNGSQPIASHIVHFSYPGMKPEVIIHMLEQQGIIASTKSACSSKEAKPSQVLLALGLNNAVASSGVRISLGEEHTKEHIDKLIVAMEHIVTQLKPLERSTSS